MRMAREFLSLGRPPGTNKGVNFPFPLLKAYGSRSLFHTVDLEQPSQCLTMPERTDQVWHFYLPEVSRGSSTATESTARMGPSRATLQPQQAGARSLCLVDCP